jgi:hypothetical protein
VAANKYLGAELGPESSASACTESTLIEQQDCSMLDWTSAANGALLVMPEAP